MNVPPEILTRLLKGEHFNVEERKKLGLWPTKPLRYDDVANHLAKVLETSDWFPCAVPVSVNGEAIREGIYIHREARDKFVCIAQRTLADNPAMLAEKNETICNTPRAATDFYLKWELNLPGRLDGWPVV